VVVIIISGTPGSGKSTVARYLAKRFKLRHVSAGDLMRELSGNLNITEFEKFHNFLRANPEIDKRIDSTIKREASRGDVVIDGVLAGFTVKNADIKIFLKAQEKIAAKRIALREKTSLKTALYDIKLRWKRNRARFKRTYNIDINDLNPYNLILDTSQWSIKEMNQIIGFIIRMLLKSKGVL